MAVSPSINWLRWTNLSGTKSAHKSQLMFHNFPSKKLSFRHFSPIICNDESKSFFFLPYFDLQLVLCDSYHARFPKGIQSLPCNSTLGWIPEPGCIITPKYYLESWNILKKSSELNMTRIPFTQFSNHLAFPLCIGWWMLRWRRWIYQSGPLPKQSKRHVNSSELKLNTLSGNVVS